MLVLVWPQLSQAAKWALEAFKNRVQRVWELWTERHLTLPEFILYTVKLVIPSK